MQLPIRVEPAFPLGNKVSMNGLFYKNVGKNICNICVVDTHILRIKIRKMKLNLEHL